MRSQDQEPIQPLAEKREGPRVRGKEIAMKLGCTFGEERENRRQREESSLHGGGHAGAGLGRRAALGPGKSAHTTDLEELQKIHL